MTDGNAPVARGYPDSETWEARPPHSDWRRIAPEHLDDYRAKEWEVRRSGDVAQGSLGCVTDAKTAKAIFERCAKISEIFGVGRERASYGGSDIAVRIRADAIDFLAEAGTIDWKMEAERLAEQIAKSCNDGRFEDVDAGCERAVVAETEVKRLNYLLADAQRIIAEYQASTIAAARADVAAHGLPGARAQTVQASSAKTLVDWTYLYATEGEAWPDDATIIEPLIKLAQRVPTQADADLLKSGSSLKELLSLSSTDRGGK